MSYNYNVVTQLGAILVSTLLLRSKVHVELRKKARKINIANLVANDSNFAANDLAIAA